MPNRVVLSVCVGLVSSVVPTSSYAGDARQAAIAEQAYNNGKRLFEDGKIGAACEQFAESHRLDPQIGSLQALAVCREKEGKTASAWQHYLDLSTELSRAGQAERSAQARTRAGELEKKLVYLSITFPKAPSGAKVSLDGTDLEASLFGKNLPVDPGEHTLSASAPKKKTWTGSVQVATTSPTTTVTVPELEDAPEAVSTVSYGAVAQPSWWGTQRIIGASLVGAGVVAGGTALVFQIFANLENNAGRNDTAKTNQNIAIGVGVGGGALLVGGVVLMLTGGPAKPKAGEVSVRPLVGPGSVGLSGTF